jgi:predicted amidohydrolase YtcJ
MHSHHETRSQPLFRAFCLLSALACLGPATGLAAETHTTAYTNGLIYTANPDMPWADTLVVEGQRLVFVGRQSDAGALLGQSAERIDLRARLVLPGLIDSHTHPGFIGMTAQQVAIPPADSVDELLGAVAQALAAHPDQDVFIGMPWSNALFDPETGPDKGLLDEIEQQRPVMIWDEWMHSLWVNSAALRAAGVDRNTLDPAPGFSFYRKDASGEPSGYITESAASDFWSKFINIDEPVTQVILDYLQYLSRHGVTTVFDAGNFGKDEEVYTAISQLDREGRLPVRYHGSYTLFLPHQLEGAVATLKSMRQRFASERLRVDTLKIFFDGVIETRTAHMLQDYRDTPGNKGEALLSRDQLHRLILELDAEGLHLHIHTVGNQAVRTALEAVEDAHRSLGRPPAIRIALSHLELVSDEDLARFAKLGVVGNYTPWWHGGSDEQYDDPALGPLAKQRMRARQLLADGARVTFSNDAYFTSDWSDGNANPFVGIQTGHTRQYPDGGAQAPVALPLDERLPLTAMVDGYTRNGAWQLGVEADLGSLQAGKKADFIVLDGNLFEMDPYRIHELRPELVVLDGEVLFTRTQ